MAIRANAEFVETIRIDDQASEELSRAQKSAEIYQKQMAELNGEILRLVKEIKTLLTSNNDLQQSQISVASSAQSTSMALIQNSAAIEQNSIFTDILIGGLKTLAVAAAGVGIFKLANQFQIVQQYTKPVIDDFLKLKKTWSDVAETLTTKINPAFFRIGELLWSSSKPLGILSVLLLQADSQFLNFVGTLTAGTAIAGGFFGVIFSMGIRAIGSLAEAIGSRLLSAMGEFEEKFEKAQLIFKQFTFTIQGFQKTLGVDAVGSLEKWNAVVDQLHQTSTFATTDIVKATKILVAEGIRFGLTQKQVGDLIIRTSDVASAYSENIVDVAGRMTSAFAGNTQSLQQMGFAVSDTDMVYDDYFLTLGKTVDQLSRVEKTNIRFNQIMHETTATVGAAANSIDTVTGSNAILDRSLTNLQTKLGATGDLYQRLVGFMARFVQKTSDAAGPFVELIGTFQEWIGISFVVSGFLLKHFVTINSLAFAYKLLSTAIASNVTVQKTLTSVMTFLGEMMGIQAVAITNLSSVFKNLQMILQGILINTIQTLTLSLHALARAAFSALVGLAGLIWSATKAIAAFTLAVITNPLFIKGALIAVSIYAIVEAFKQLVNEVPFLRDGFVSLKKTVLEFFKIFESDEAKSSESWFVGFSDAAKVALNDVIQTFKIFLASLFSGFTALHIAILQVQLVWKSLFSGTPEELESIENRIDELRGRLNQFGGAIANGASNMVLLGGRAAYAATGADTLKTSIDKAAKATETLTTLVNLNLKSFDASSERMKIIGNEFDQSVQSIVDANKKLAEASASTVELDQKSKDITEALTEAIKERFKQEKLASDTAKTVADQTQTTQLSILKASGQTIAAIKAETAEKLKSLDKQATGLEQIGFLTDENKKKIEEARKALQRESKLQIAEELKKQADKAKEKLAEIQKITDEVNQKVLESATTLVSMRESEYDKILTAAFQEKESLKTLKGKIDTSKDLSEVQKKQLTIAIDTASALKDQTAQVKIGQLATQKYLEVDASRAEVKRELARFDLDAVELAEEELQYQLSLLDEKRKQLVVDRAYNQEALDAINEQITLTEKLGARKIAAAEGGSVFGNIGREVDSAIAAIQPLVGRFNEVAKQIGLIQSDGFDFSIDNLKSSAQLFGQGVMDRVVAGYKDVTDDLKGAAKAFGNFVLDAIDYAITALVNNVGAVFDFGADLLGGVFVTQFADVLGAIADIPKVWSDAIKKIDQSINSLLRAFPQLIANVTKQLPELAKKLAESAPAIATALAKAAPALTQAIVQSMPLVIRAVADGLVILADALPDIVEKIAEGLPGILTALASAIPRVFVALLDALPGIVEAIANNFGPIVEALVSGLISASGRIVAGLVNSLLVDGGLERIAGAILRGIRDGLIGALKGIVGGIKGLFKIPNPKIENVRDLVAAAKDIKAAFAGDKSSLFAVKDLAEEARGSAQDQAKQLAGGIKEGMAEAGRQLRGVMDQLLALWRQFWDGIVAMWRQLWDGITAAWRALWDGLVAIWRGLWDGLTAAWRAVWDSVKAVWDGMVSLLTNAWNAIIKPLWDGMVGLLTGAWSLIQSGWTALVGALSAGWTAITNGLQAVFAPIVSVFSSFGATVTQAFSPVLSVFSASGSLTGTVTTAFAGVTGIFSATGTLSATVSKAFLPLTSWKFPNAPDNFINWKFPGAPTNFLLWNWPTLPKWTWPALPSLGINFDANAIGVNIGAGFWNKLAQLGVSNLGSDMAGGLWNKLLQLGISNLGSDMAVGLWNKLITFDFGKLLGGGGGSSLPKLFGSTGGMVTNDGFKYFASGGLARGTDTVPAMLTPGEFVVNRQATRENFRELRDINSGRGQQASAGIVIQKIEINGVNKTADQIASEIIPKIDQHLRRKSQDGGMVIAKSGVRG